MSIFPDIPRFPDEPKSEGAPKRAHESILLAEEEGLPFLYEIGEDLKKFKDLEVAEKQRQFQAELAQKLLKDPQKFEEFFKRGLEIVGWGTDIFPQKSLSEKNYVKYIFSGDDELLRQQLEIDAVTWYFLQKFFPEKHLQMQKSIGEIVKLPETQKAASEFTKRQPARMKILSDFYNDIDIKSGLSPVDPEKLKEWPYDLIMNGGPLRKLFNERVSLEGNQVALFLQNKGFSLFS